MTSFETYANAHGFAWHAAAGIHLRDWIRGALVSGWSIDQVAAELAKISDAFATIGAADPTTSILCTAEMLKHSPIKPPQGWPAEAVEMWRKLPYAAARWVSEKRAQDVKELRRIQNELASLKQKEKENANPASA